MTIMSANVFTISPDKQTNKQFSIEINDDDDDKIKEQDSFLVQEYKSNYKLKRHKKKHNRLSKCPK